MIGFKCLQPQHRFLKDNVWG